MAAQEGRLGVRPKQPFVDRVLAPSLERESPIAVIRAGRISCGLCVEAGPVPLLGTLLEEQHGARTLPLFQRAANPVFRRKANGSSPASTWLRFKDR